MKMSKNPVKYKVLIKQYLRSILDISGQVPLCQIEGTHQIVMPFSPPAVGCLLKVAEHSFQVPVPNSPLLLNYLCFGAHFLHESRLITDVFILTF